MDRASKRGLVTVLVGVPIVAVAAVGWHYADRILGPDEPMGRTGQTVLAHSDTTITLASTTKARRPGTWAIVWPGGFGRVDSILAIDGGRVVRRFEILGGAPPDTTSRLAGYATDADPRTWLGLDFERLVIPSRAGPLPAWLVPGSDSTWAVFVHGRAALRAEPLRMLAGYRALGLPCLLITYRNDPDGGPRVGDGRYRLGATEWRDLEDAVRWARAHGARDVVVVGCSMGGGIVAQYLRKSAERAITRAAVLDAPTLDWSVIVTDQGAQERVPAVVAAWGELVASLRSGLDWSDLSQSRHAREFVTPMLIFHGDADRTVPLRLSREFAAVRPDLVTLVVVPGAGHVESANFEGSRYAATVRDWLRGLKLGSTPVVAAPARAP